MVTTPRASQCNKQANFCNELPWKVEALIAIRKQIPIFPIFTIDQPYSKATSTLLQPYTKHTMD